MRKRELVDEEGFRRVHRLTPLLRFWSLILALGTIFVLNFNLEALQDIATYLQGGHWSEIGWGSLIALGAVVALCLVIWFASELWWRRLGFKLDEEEISIKHGLLSTSLRSARYDRTQAVDVVESVIARIFGLAAVRVETAGGTMSVLQVAYLPKTEAEALRADVMSRVQGQRPLADVAPERPADLVPEIPIGRTLGAEILRLTTLILVVGAGALSYVEQLRPITIPLLVGYVPSMWALIDSGWRYTARLADDGKVLSISYGLADKRRQSIRLDRVHGVSISQPLLWRLRGWYEISVSVAGYGARGGGKQSGSTRILPVGSREQAMCLAAVVTHLSPQELEEFARPEGHTRPDFTSPRRAWWVSPVDLKQQAVTIVRDNVVIHSGRLGRKVKIVPMAHIQELAYRQGPLGRLCGVGDVRLNLVNGPVRMSGQDLDPYDAAALLRKLRSRALPAARSYETDITYSGDSQAETGQT